MTKPFLTVMLIVLIAISYGACTRKTNFLTSSIVPAARGYVTVKQDNNKNYVVDVHLSDLAEVERLQPSKNTYVVWMVTGNQDTKNLGQINSASGWMSNSLKARFETVTSFKPSKIFITAENDGNISYPGTQVVLTTANF